MWWETWFSPAHLPTQKVIGPLGPVHVPVASRRPYQCLVTDMDECLIHTWDRDEMNYARYKRTFNTPKAVGVRHAIFGVEMNALHPEERIYGVMRPGLVDFLNYAFTRFDYVILWSAGTSYYVNQITEYMFSKTDKMPDNVFSRPYCQEEKEKIQGEPTEEQKELGERLYHTKPLKKLYDVNPHIKLSNIFFLDDNPRTSQHNKTNHILIPRFEPEPTVDGVVRAMDTDRCLYDLIAWLERPDVKAAQDIRKLDKSKIFTSHV